MLRGPELAAKLILSILPIRTVYDGDRKQQELGVSLTMNAISLLPLARRRGQGHV
jgi:hypothetical protein